MSLYFLGGDPIPYIGLVPIDPQSSFVFTRHLLDAFDPEADVLVVHPPHGGVDQS